MNIFSSDESITIEPSVVKKLVPPKKRRIETISVFSSDSSDSEDEVATLSGSPPQPHSQPSPLPGLSTQDEEDALTPSFLKLTKKMPTTHAKTTTTETKAKTTVAVSVVSAHSSTDINPRIRKASLEGLKENIAKRIPSNEKKRHDENSNFTVSKSAQESTKKTTDGEPQKQAEKNLANKKKKLSIKIRVDPNKKQATHKQQPASTNAASSKSTMPQSVLVQVTAPPAKTKKQQGAKNTATKDHNSETAKPITNAEEKRNNPAHTSPSLSSSAAVAKAVKANENVHSPTIKQTRNGEPVPKVAVEKRSLESTTAKRKAPASSAIEKKKTKKGASTENAAAKPDKSRTSSAANKKKAKADKKNPPKTNVDPTANVVNAKHEQLAPTAAAKKKAKAETTLPKTSNDQSKANAGVKPIAKTDKKKPPKVAATKKPMKLNLQDQVVNKLFWSLKPFTLRSLSEELKATESTVEFCMLSLVDKGIIMKKDFTSPKGRVKTLYWANHDAKSKEVNLGHESTAEERHATKQTVERLQAEDAMLKKKLAALLQEPSNDELDEKLAKAEASLIESQQRVQQVKDRIANHQARTQNSKKRPFSSACSTSLICSPRSMKMRINHMRNEWKTRKDKCRDFVDLLADGMEKKPNDVVKLLELETDESCDATLPPKHVMD